jgi:hypothetical protein
MATQIAKTSIWIAVIVVLLLSTAFPRPAASGSAWPSAGPTPFRVAISVSPFTELLLITRTERQPQKRSMSCRKFLWRTGQTKFTRELPRRAQKQLDSETTHSIVDCCELGWQNRWVFLSTQSSVCLKPMEMFAANLLLILLNIQN